MRSHLRERVARSHVFAKAYDETRINNISEGVVHIRPGRKYGRHEVGSAGGSAGTACPGLFFGCS